MKTKNIKFISKRALMLFVALLFTFPFLKAQNWQIEPDEYLVMAFEDSTGSKDTVIVGFYDSGEYEPDEGIVTPGVDTAFGEINMPVYQQDTFAARSIRDDIYDDEFWEDIFDENLSLKIDIRPNDSTCYYAADINHDDFFIEFYNAVNPIVAKIQVFQPGYECGSENPSGCFCAEYKNWERILWKNKYGDIEHKSYNDNISDTIYLAYPEFDDVGLRISVSGSKSGVSLKRLSAKQKIELTYNSLMQTVRIESEDIINVAHIVDLQGRIVKEATLNEEMINLDVSSLSRGIYIIKILSNNQYYTYKLLKPF